MKRTSLRDRILPSYTKGEEIFNMVTHIFGGCLGVTYLIFCIIKAAMNNDVYAIVGSTIYGFSVIILFTISSIYHGLKPGMAKKVFQVIDHCTIYVMIAGTYTPITLSAIMRINPSSAWLLFGIVWGVTIFAMIFTGIDHIKFKKLSMICYIGLGWCVVLFLKVTIAALGKNGMLLLAIGGILYTIGAVLYGIGKKKKYVHSIFHILVDLASLFQFLSIYFYVI